LKNSITFLFASLILIIQGCCGEPYSGPVYYLYLKKFIAIKNNTDTIYSIGYYGSELINIPKKSYGEFFLSEANENTTLFIYSTLGYDTMVIKQVKNYELKSESQCEGTNINKTVEDFIILSHSFNSFKKTSKLIKSYNGSFKDYQYDTLTVE
jgi:hypothetical protein